MERSKLRSRYLLLLLFDLQKSDVKAHQILLEVYGDAAPSSPN